MAEISNYLENALINGTLRATTYIAPTTVYVSLHYSDPTDAGTGTELSGGSYARTAATFAAPTNGSSSTSANVAFPQATSNWGTIGWIGIWDAQTSGNMLYHTALDAVKTIEIGDIFNIATGSLTVTLA